MLYLRPVTPEDLPCVWSIIEDVKDTILTDYEVWNTDLAEAICYDPLCFLACEPQGENVPDYPIAVIRFSDQAQNLSVVFHFAARPHSLKKLLQSNIFADSAEYAFQNLKVKKLKAFVLDSQTTAIKLLCRHGFGKRGSLYRETKQGGRYKDMLIFELYDFRWKHWKRHTKDFIERGKREAKEILTKKQKEKQKA